MQTFGIFYIICVALVRCTARSDEEQCCELDSSYNDTYSSEEDEGTFFEILDDVIYKSLSEPRPGCSDKLLADIGMFQECLARVKRMYTEMEGEKIEELRNSIVRLYATRGGPTFTRFPINKAKNKRKLLMTFEWSEENLSNLNELLEELENVWYALRHTVI